MSEDKRKSGVFMLKIQESIAEDSLPVTDKRRIDWENAVTKDLEEVMNKQEELEKQIEDIKLYQADLSSPEVKVSKSHALQHDLNDKGDCLTEKMKGKRESCINEISDWKKKCSDLEECNEILILENEKHKKEVDDLSKYLQGEYTTFG